jgi:fatty-acyl-CoA synthase
MKMNFARTTREIADRYPHLEALVNVERGRRYSFAEFDRLTNRIINLIHGKLGLARGDRYLCILDNDNLSLLHAPTVLKGAAAAAWTNYRDSLDEHLWQIDWIEPKAVFLESNLVERFHGPLRERGIRIVAMDPCPGFDDVDHFWDMLEGVSDADPGFETDITDDPIIYRFTGGTTGKSKCAEYSIDNWLAGRDAYYVPHDNPFSPGGRTLLMAPLSHGGSVTILPAFFRGCCMVTQNAPDLDEWCRNVEHEKITIGGLVPTLCYRLLELESADRYDLSTLDWVYYGAAPMSAAKLAGLQERFGNIFVQIYGSTECWQPATLLGKADHLAEGEDLAFRLASAGRVTPGTELIIADDDGHEVPGGQTGEIWIRSRANIRGYYRNPETTAQEFTNGFWKSGDLGFRDPRGFITIVDRKKDMVITGGFNVYAIEVESAINAHPAVSNSAVVGVPHPEWGEAVHAEVILKSGNSASEEEIVAFVKGRIGKHKAPKTVTFVPDLPVSAAHKVLRRAVRDKYWAGKTRRVG